MCKQKEKQGKYNEKKRKQARRASRSVLTPTNHIFGVCTVYLATLKVATILVASCAHVLLILGVSDGTWHSQDTNVLHQVH